MKEGSCGTNNILLWRAGQSTLELLIALAIVALSVGAAAIVFFSSRALLLDAELAADASYRARRLLEVARLTAEQDFAALVSASSTAGEFFEEVTVEAMSSDDKKVKARVSWQTDPLRAQRVELVTILTNWRAVAALGGDTGGGGLSGDWKNPRTLGSIDLGPGNSATDLDVINKIVYMTAEASAASKPDFFIIDATNGESPAIVSSLDTGPSLNALDAVSGYAYVANRDADAQLQVIDTRDIYQPALRASFKLPGVSGAGAMGQSIFYADAKAYIGTEKATGPEFHIIDVTNPANPSSLGSIEVNADVNSIYVRGTVAYLATSDNEELQVYDISNPANITKLGGYDAPGDSEDGKALTLVGATLYLGRTLGGKHTNHHELHILDVASSTAPLNLGSKDIAADVNDLRVRDYLAFLATDDPNKEFQVWNISDPTAITLWKTFNFPQVATGIDYEDNLVYVGVRSNDALRIITSSP